MDPTLSKTKKSMRIERMVGGGWKVPDKFTVADEAFFLARINDDPNLEAVDLG